MFHTYIKIYTIQIIKYIISINFSSDWFRCKNLKLSVIEFVIHIQNQT
jgi:hypothetical protein